MNEVDGSKFIHETSRQLCEEMLGARYEDPTHTQFPVSQFESVWSRLRTRNECQIHQAITPLIVPPPEFLFFNGHQSLEHLAQEVCADWTKSQPPPGPVPRPDFAIGIRSSAFTDGELEKMRCYSSWRRGALFTDNMYFPFLVCKVKACTQDISGAERQSVRACAMAVDAIIQLYRILGEAEASKLSGQILAISVTHDQTWVLIYEHYVIITGDQATHYRHPIMGGRLVFGGGPIAGWKMAHDFVRAVYDKFYPNHLKRIKDALAQMPGPEATSRIDSRSMRGSRAEFNSF
ncbi:hypothetical protein PV04_10794 [Phialophora macrospora]|uniref:DUF7924 domain-containing protein n=1 Tax=Phialophora macrospora TaxID=1851006 RepID=A0A0D2DJT3_9EURO|nr:hypothetical protein PV04_10794 [Phialophora macrospora]